MYVCHGDGGRDKGHRQGQRSRGTWFSGDGAAGRPVPGKAWTILLMMVFHRAGTVWQGRCYWHLQACEAPWLLSRNAGISAGAVRRFV